MSSIHIWKKKNVYQHKKLTNIESALDQYYWYLLGERIVFNRE